MLGANLIYFLQASYGQQSYGTYGQPSDSSYTQAQTTAATYGQSAYAAAYGQPPAGKNSLISIFMVLQAQHLLLSPYDRSTF